MKLYDSSNRGCYHLLFGKAYLSSTKTGRGLSVLNEGIGKWGENLKLIDSYSTFFSKNACYLGVFGKYCEVSSYASCRFLSENGRRC